MMTLLAENNTPDPSLVAPGMGAFTAFFLLAIVVVLLGWSMTRQVRRSEQRNAERARVAAEEAEAAEQPTTAEPEQVQHPKTPEQP